MSAWDMQEWRWQDSGATVAARYTRQARFRDAMKQPMAWKDEDSDFSSKLMTVMDAQQETFEVTENI